MECPKFEIALFKKFVGVTLPLASNLSHALSTSFIQHTTSQNNVVWKLHGKHINLLLHTLENVKFWFFYWPIQIPLSAYKMLNWIN